MTPEQVAGARLAIAAAQSAQKTFVWSETLVHWLVKWIEAEEEKNAHAKDTP
jgi:hypothetical protein